MKKEYKNIEDLFRESFDGYKTEPSADLWKKINFKLNFKDFFSANYRTFNIYYLSVISGLITTLAVLFSNQRPIKQELPKNTYNQIKIENPKITVQEVREEKTGQKKKKTTISYPTEIYTQTDIKNARENQNSDLVPLPLRNDLKQFSKIYGDTLNKIGSIKVSPPVPLFSIESKNGCAPFEISLKNHTKFAQYYEWTFGDGNKSTLQNPVHTYQYPGIYSIRLKAIGIGGIGYSLIDSIIIFDKPKVKISWPYQSYLFEGEKFSILSESQNSVSCKWDFGDGTFSNQKKPEHFYKEEGNYSITITSWTDKNCIDSIKVADVEVVKIESLILFPNAFCPNPDGPSTGNYSAREIHNEVFHPVVKYEILEYQLKIYTKEGAQVFESDNVHVGWDGYYQKQRMPEGVYPYIVSGKFEGGRNFLKKGNVTIIYRQ